MTLFQTQASRVIEESCIMHSLVWIQQISRLDRCQLLQREDGLCLLFPTPVVRQDSTQCMTLHWHTHAIPRNTSTTSTTMRQSVSSIPLPLGHSILTRSLLFLVKPSSLVRGPSRRHRRMVLPLAIHVFRPSESRSMRPHRSSNPQGLPSVRPLGCLNCPSPYLSPRDPCQCRPSYHQPHVTNKDERRGSVASRALQLIMMEMTAARKTWPRSDSPHWVRLRGTVVLHLRHRGHQDQRMSI
jgi:hypothetical protein